MNDTQNLPLDVSFQKLVFNFLKFLILGGAMSVGLMSLHAGDTSALDDEQQPFQIHLVSVGDAGNQADPKTGKGSVDVPFEIGKFAITASQYCAFLNAVAVDDPYQLYQSSMQFDRAVRSIIRHGHAGSYHYSVISGRDKLPIACVNWYAAARFCNWLENRRPQAPEGPSTTEQGAYALNGMMRNSKDSDPFLSHQKDITNSVAENPQAHWRLPTENEWYKAAFYKGGSLDAGYWLYPTQSNEEPNNEIGNKFNQANYYHDGYYSTRPSFYGSYISFFNENPCLTPVGLFEGSPGAYGTFDMAGNVQEWTSSFVVTKQRKTSLFSTLPVGPINYTVLLTARLVMGGSWANYRDLDSLHCSYKEDEVSSNHTVGFRVVHIEEPSSDPIAL